MLKAGEEVFADVGGGGKGVEDVRLMEAGGAWVALGEAVPLEGVVGRGRRHLHSQGHVAILVHLSLRPVHEGHPATRNRRTIT